MGVAPVGWSHELDGALLNSNSDDAFLQLILPQGICTAHPLKFRVLYGYKAYVGQPDLELLQKAVEVARNIVADPAGGLVPIERTIALTALTGATVGVQDTWQGDVLAVEQITRHTTPPLDISAYYEGDMVAFRFTLVADGGGSDVLMYGLEIEGVQFTDGTIE